jgi:hypothetical protein
MEFVAKAGRVGGIREIDKNSATTKIEPGRVRVELPEGPRNATFGEPRVRRASVDSSNEGEGDVKDLQGVWQPN